MADLNTRVALYVKDWEEKVYKELHSTKVQLHLSRGRDRVGLKMAIETLREVYYLLQGGGVTKRGKQSRREEITFLTKKLQKTEDRRWHYADRCCVLEKQNCDLKIQLERQFNTVLERGRKTEALLRLKASLEMNISSCADKELARGPCQSLTSMLRILRRRRDVFPLRSAHRTKSAVVICGHNLPVS